LSLYVKKSGAAVALNGDSNVTTANVEASNGIIHRSSYWFAYSCGCCFSNDNFSSLVEH
jgi:hypothetical protein